MPNESQDPTRISQINQKVINHSLATLTIVEMFSIKLIQQILLLSKTCYLSPYALDHWLNDLHTLLSNIDSIALKDNKLAKELYELIPANIVQEKINSSQLKKLHPSERLVYLYSAYSLYANSVYADQAAALASTSIDDQLKLTTSENLKERLKQYLVHPLEDYIQNLRDRYQQEFLNQVAIFTSQIAIAYEHFIKQSKYLPKFIYDFDSACLKLYTELDNLDLLIEGQIITIDFAATLNQELPSPDRLEEIWQWVAKQEDSPAKSCLLVSLHSLINYLINGNFAAQTEEPQSLIAYLTEEKPEVTQQHLLDDTLSLQSPVAPWIEEVPVIENKHLLDSTLSPEDFSSRYRLWPTPRDYKQVLDNCPAKPYDLWTSPTLFTYKEGKLIL